MFRKILVQEAPFDSGRELRLLGESSTRIGAMASFIGLVRDVNETDAVVKLHLEHYPGMTERQIAAIVDEAQSRWQLLGVTVIHRTGDLYPTDEIVLVAAASEHRRDALDACDFIMDYLKTRVTFWKKESTPQGHRWLTTRQQDLDAVSAREK